MSLLAFAYTRGRQAAYARYKLAAAAAAPVSNPTVSGSALLGSRASTPPAGSKPQIQAPTHPGTIQDVFNATEQSKTRIEPNKKLADSRCTTCRKEKHYGPCLKPTRTRPDGEPLKAAAFNMGLTGDDPAFATAHDGPSVSPNYTSATSDSALARARDGRPAIEQAATAFATQPGINWLADQAVNNTGGLNKTSGVPRGLLLAAYGGHVPLGQGPNGLYGHETPFARKRYEAHTMGQEAATLMSKARRQPTPPTAYQKNNLEDVVDDGWARRQESRQALPPAATGVDPLAAKLGMSPSVAIHSSAENRGPTDNIYEQLRVPSKAPVVGWGDEGDQRIDRAFSQIDNTADSTCIEDGSKGPSTGPAVLG